MEMITIEMTAMQMNQIIVMEMIVVLKVVT